MFGETRLEGMRRREKINIRKLLGRIIADFKVLHQCSTRRMFTVAVELWNKSYCLDNAKMLAENAGNRVMSPYVQVQKAIKAFCNSIYSTYLVETSLFTKFFMGAGGDYARLCMNNNGIEEWNKEFKK